MNPNVKSTRQTGKMSGCKILVYGPSGGGKTRLIASAPKPLLISAEKGTMSLRDFDVPVWEIRQYNDMIEVFKFLHTHEGKQFFTPSLDSVSEIAETLHSELKRKNSDPRKLYPDLQDKIASMIRSFRDLPGRNCVLLAKEEIVKDQMGGVTYRPNFPGQQLAQQAPYFVDEVFHLRSWNDSTGRYWGLQTQPSATHTAKDRSGRLAELENADPATGGGLTYIFNKMLG